MARKKMTLHINNYISAMYQIANELGYNIENITETVTDKANNITTTIVIGYKIKRIDEEFIVRIDKDSNLNSLQQVSERIINEMQRNKNKFERKIRFTESTTTEVLTPSTINQNNKKEETSKKVIITPQNSSNEYLFKQLSKEKGNSQPKREIDYYRQIKDGVYSYLIGTTVFNKRNGYGTIESFDNIIIQVKFPKVTKRYLFPDAILEGIIKPCSTPNVARIDNHTESTKIDNRIGQIASTEAPVFSDIFDKPQSNALSLEKYILTDENCVNNRVCPKCRYTLWLKRYNIPVYDRTRKFISYYVDNLHWCPTCKVAYMTETTYMRIQKRVNKDTKYIRPSNIRSMVKKHPQRYLYEPTLNESLILDKETIVSGSEGVPITNLASSSFLSDEGYGISKSRNERHEILDRAVKEHGKRRVADHLRFLIRTRQGQREGMSKYANAIGIWSDDLDYVVNLKL